MTWWVLVLVGMVMTRHVDSQPLDATEETTAIRWLARHNEELMNVRFETMQADWNYATNITEENQEEKVGV